MSFKVWHYNIETCNKIYIGKLYFEEIHVYILLTIKPKFVRILNFFFLLQVYYISVTNLKKNKPKFWGLTIFFTKLIVDSTDDTRWWHSKQQEMSHTLYTAQKNSGTKYCWKSVSRKRGEDRTNRRLPDPSGEQVRLFLT